MAADGLSQADTASSESRRGSPMMMPTPAPKGKNTPLHSTGFHSLETSPSFSQRSSPKPVQLSLTSALKLSGGTKQIRQKGASLVTMLLRQDVQGRTPCAQQQASPQEDLPEERLRHFAQIVANDFQKNVGKPSQPRKHSLRMPALPREMG